MRAARPGLKSLSAAHTAKRRIEKRRWIEEKERERKRRQLIERKSE